MTYLVYVIACFLQPICWPLPEASTIFLGASAFGEIKAFIIGYIFIIMGIIFMYKVTFYLSNKYLKKFKSSMKFKKYQQIIKKNEVFTTGILFILPILPDEVICIGSAILGIKFKVFIAIALIAKFISIGLYAFSESFSVYFGIDSFLFLLIEVLLVIIVSYIYNLKKK